MVSAVKSESTPEAVVRAVDETGIKIKAGSKVFIKIDASPEFSTSPEIVSTLIKISKVNGAGEIGVGDRVRTVSPDVVQAIEKAGAKYVDLAASSDTKVRSKGAPSLKRGFRLPRPILNADIVILAPKVMISERFGFLGALTSAYSLLSSFQRFTIDNFGKTLQKLVEVQSAIPVGLAVADLTSIDVSGHHFTPNMVIAGRRTEVDEEIQKILVSFGAKLPLPPEEMPTIAHAKRIGLDAGSTDIGLVHF